MRAPGGQFEPGPATMKRNPALFPRTQTHVQAGAPVEREADLHDQIEAWCRARGYYVVHSRMDRPTTTQVGVPDWLIFAQNRVVAIECKRKGAKPTPSQLAAQAQLRKLGHVCEVVRSMDEFLKAMTPF